MTTMDENRRKKVLVVSHDIGAKRAYSAIAHSGGWTAIACDPDDDVVATIDGNQIDALIFDYSPSVGIEALRRVRHAGLDLPAILITAHPVNHEEMMALDVKVILPKPPDVERLREALAALTVKTTPASDFKILFEFLERCNAAQRAKESRLSREE